MNEQQFGDVDKTLKSKIESDNTAEIDICFRARKHIDQNVVLL